MFSSKLPDRYGARTARLQPMIRTGSYG